jgi:putative ABC transport system substrate-binding protein
LLTLGSSAVSVALVSACDLGARTGIGAPKVPRIGWLGGAQTGSNFRLDAFRAGMRDLGYVEGQQYLLDYRLAEPDQLPAVADELVKAKVDIILASGTQASLAAKRATVSIPIVMGATADPVGVGLVASLARPGGNVTGMTLLSSQVSGKRLQILQDAFPGLSRVGVFFNPDNPLYAAVLSELDAAAQTLKITVSRLEIHGAADVDRALASAATERADALFVPADQLTTNNRAHIIDLVARSRMRAMYELREFVDDGGLMSYGPNVGDLYRRAAVRHVDRILKGALPADIPIEQPTKFDFVVNLTAVQAYGLDIPAAVMTQATELVH